MGSNSTRLQVDRGDIAEAITLFQYSNTALSNGRARVVIQNLQDLYQRDEIGFRDLGPGTLHGTWRQGRRGHDLQININFFSNLTGDVRLGRLSLLLVHEATHATVNFTKLYDEMAARMLPILYWRELSGPGVFNEANDEPGGGASPSRTVRLAAASLPEFDRQNRALIQDQLIDDILSIKTYTRSSYITPQWILDNLNNWRGLRNRWPQTRGLYVRLLAQSVDPYFTRAIIDIMESITNQAEWDGMMSSAGPLRSIQIALDDLSARPQFSGRIIALERRWHVSLREQI